MDKTHVIQEWIDSTKAAIEALQTWNRFLTTARTPDPPTTMIDFDDALGDLNDVLGDNWADKNPAGDGLDCLRQAVIAQDLYYNDIFYDPDLNEWITIDLAGNIVHGQTYTQCAETAFIADVAYLAKMPQEHRQEKEGKTK